MVVDSLWGEEFSIKDNTQEIINKAKKPKKVKDKPVEKLLESKTASFESKLELITENVNKILGHYKDDTICIYSRDEFHDYISKAIENGIIAIDTETLGTRTDIDKPATDPFTCRIAGLCLYTPGKKNAYIPINHINFQTGERWSKQLTESDIKDELSRIVGANTTNIFHNGKFDYMVLYYTCGIKVPITWDTMIGAQLLNENERAGLKFQYRDKIDPSQEKYDIDKLFNLDDMAKYPPELFALYAATDSYMTYLLYEYQKKEFEKKGNEKLYSLFKDIEMPVVTVTSEMEMRGVAVDKVFAKRLSEKFHKKLDELNDVIDIEMAKYKSIIDQWRLSPEANAHEIVKGKSQKSLNEKLADPIELTSPTQLGILLYDVLHVLKAGSDGKKTTDENALLSIKDKLPLAKMILKKREYEKYLGTYIDVLPTYCNPRDDKVHAHFNQMGREDRNVVTGRMSSSDPSLQVIPARGDIVTVRCMFTPSVEEYEYELKNVKYDVPIEDEVELGDGSYKWSSELVEGDILNTGEVVDFIKVVDNIVKVFIK